MEARWHNHYCCGIALSITYSECVSVALLSGMQCVCAASYFHLLSVWFQHIFPHYPINCTIFLKESLNTKCVFWFSVRILPGTFPIPRTTERDVIKAVCRSACTVPVVVVVVRFSWNLNIWQIFEKSRNVRFHEKPSIWEPRFCMRTDRLTEDR